MLKVISHSAFDLDEVLTTLIEMGIHLCDAARGVIWLCKGEQLVLAAHVGYPAEWVAHVQEHPITPAADTTTGTGLAAYTGEIVHSEDILADPRFASNDAHKLGDYRAALAVPLKRDGRVEGVIALSRPVPQLFTDRQIALIQTFADQAVIAVENVRLFEEAQARTRDMQEALEFQTATSDVLNVIRRSPNDLQPVLDTIVETAHDLCQAQYALFFKLGPTGLYHIAASRNANAAFVEWLRSHPIAAGDGTATGLVAAEKRIIHLRDALADPRFTDHRRQQQSKARTQLAVPLMRAGAVIGVIFLARTELNPFSDRQINLISTFADQAVIAVNNVRLFEEVQARTAELSEALQQQTATSDVLKVISRSAFNLQAVLDTLVASAARLCGAENAFIYQREDELCHLAAMYGISAGHKKAASDYERFLRGDPISIDRGTLVGRTTKLCFQAAISSGRSRRASSCPRKAAS